MEKISSAETNNVKIWSREQKGYYAYTHDMIALWASEQKADWTDTEE